MKFNIILLFCLCFTSGLLTASSLHDNVVDMQELPVSDVDGTGEVLPLTSDNLSISVIDDDSCLRATVTITQGNFSLQVEVEGCGATAHAAWAVFVAAVNAIR